ncbi:hypothetical protein QE152_g28416 [Popillia japonica]|uniref:Uncharacterized protein n=1 Tax=Popillia japonica TaxID=7064 RepID=A0AAW1JKJ0_POPJA
MLFLGMNKNEESLQQPVTPSTSASSYSSQSTEKRKVLRKDTSLAQKKAKFLEAASAALSAADEPFGKIVALDLNDMEVRQRIIAQKIISDVLYYGKLGHLTENCAFTLPMQTLPLHHSSHSGISHDYYSYQAHTFPHYTHGLRTTQPVLSASCDNEVSEFRLLPSNK